jgi:hypothetical protein
MARFFGWIVERLRWLLLAAAAGGAVMVYIGWSDAQRIRDVETNGIETVARIDGATRTKGRRSGESYSLKLAWRDNKGGIQTHETVKVSNTFALQIIRNDRVVRDAVRIKYLPDATIDSVPIVLEDAARQEEQDESMMKFGFGLAGVGAVGSGLFFLLGRRRNRVAA